MMGMMKKGGCIYENRGREINEQTSANWRIGMAWRRYGRYARVCTRAGTAFISFIFLRAFHG